MAKWFHAHEPMEQVEREALRKLLSPLVAKLDGRISMTEIEDFNSRSDCDIWFGAEPYTGIRSVMVTRLKHYDAGLRVLCLTHGAGELEDFGPDSMAMLEAFAKSLSCRKLQVDGCADMGPRMTCGPGFAWDKLLGEGWREFSRSIEKEIGCG